MESLVNYSSEDDQDDYQYSKVASRERVGAGTNSSSGLGRGSGDASRAGGHLKRTYEHSRSGSAERTASPYHKGGEGGSVRPKGGNTNNYYEDKYKIDRRAEKPRDHREKREKRDSKSSKDMREDSRDYDNGHKYDYKKHDDHKRYRESKRDHKRSGNDYNRDDKRYNRYDDRKTTYSSNYKDRFNSSKSRYDDRKPYDDRFNSEDRKNNVNDDRRGGGNFEDRRREHGDRRNFNDDDGRKTDRRYNDDRRTQRSYNEDRSNAYHPRRSNSPPSTTQRNCSNFKYVERKDEGNNRRERKRHSRSKSRSRSRSVEKTNECVATSPNNSHQRMPTETLRPDEQTQISENKPLPSARNFEALLTLPLSENTPKHPNVVVVPAASVSTGTNSTSTVQLPSYYNPNVINPNKYVEQMQKRKLIWGAKKSEDCASKWGHAQFSQDQDGKVASKFMRLMGIKSSASAESSASPTDNEKKSTSSTSPPNSAVVQSREAMFSSMEQQYEVARQVTHTMRGVGLGFGSQSRPF